MVVKTPVLPKRVRKIPSGFSWIDHRLVRDRRIDLLSHGASALYLFLVCVGDDKGLSYYGDASMMRRVSMDLSVLGNARKELMDHELIAWRSPVYQVLDLEPVDSPVNRSRGPAMSLGDILKKAMGSMEVSK